MRGTTRVEENIPQLLLGARLHYKAKTIFTSEFSD